MTNIFNTVSGIFDSAGKELEASMIDSARVLFDNGFFKSAFALLIAGFGYGWALGYIQGDLGKKAITALVAFGIVIAMMNNNTAYDLMKDTVNLPKNMFYSAIKGVAGIGDVADSNALINGISESMNEIYLIISSKGGITNMGITFIALIIWLVSTFLIFAMCIMLVFSNFLALVVFTLAPMVIPTLIFNKTRGIFFSWIKLYISLTLYAPMTLLFGLITIEVMKQADIITNKLQADFFGNLELVGSLVIAELMIAYGIFQIPSFINQIIGSSNNGMSMSGAVSTMSGLATAAFGGGKVLNNTTDVARKLQQYIGRKK